MSYSTVDEAVAAIRRGRPVVVLDDEDREDEADLVMAAEHVMTADVAFFLTHTSGFLCTALAPDRVDELGLPPMVRQNGDALGTAFTVSVDVRAGTTTGISAADRAATCRALADPATRPGDLARPGHVLPLRARPGGVLSRRGHTEAGVDLCRLAGSEPAALICELVTPDRTDMLRGPDAVAFAHRHGLPVITIAALAERLAAVVRTGSATIPAAGAAFTAVSYRDPVVGVEHVAMVLGEVGGTEPVLCRVHAGTDAFSAGFLPEPVLHGDSLHHELALLVDAGLSTVEALRSATALAARHFGLADRGAITPGLRADLVLLGGDPLADISATRTIERVWCAGVEVSWPSR